MKNFLTIFSLMVIVAISGCEKDPSNIPPEDLEIGSLYTNGAITGFVVALRPDGAAIPEIIEIMSETDIVCFGHETYDYEKDGWKIPVNGQLITISQAGLWTPTYNFVPPESYWSIDNGTLFYFNLLPPFNPDDGNKHRLRLYQKIYL